MSKTSIIDTSALKDKLQEYATKVGRISARPLLLLYFIMVSKDTPKSDKLMILSTISYLIFPVDLSAYYWVDRRSVFAICRLSESEQEYHSKDRAQN